MRPRWAIDVESLRERLRDVAGFTLIETLVTAVAAVVVLSATFALLESGQQVQARDSEWAVALQEDRAGLARMMRDIRQATEILEPTTGAASSYISFLAIIGSTKWKIKYDCSVSQTGTTFTECVRFAAEEGKSFPANGARTVIDVTDGNAVFSYSPTTRSEAKLVTAKIELPAKGTLRQAGSSGYSHKVVLEDGAFMRNVYFEG
jgi:type II secretory pathway pseudopilin PulG